MKQVSSRLILALAAATAIAGCGGWSQNSIAESQARGERIVAGLERYKAQHRKYPDSLDSLLNGFLTEIEPPTAGNRSWKYRARQKGQDFELGFVGAEEEPTCWYVRSGNEWWLDTK